MKRTASVGRNLDAISDKQVLICWGFNFRELETYNMGSYAYPVCRALLLGMKELTESRNKFIRMRHFTVFAGDYGDENEYFWAGIRHSISHRVVDIFSKHLKALRGYYQMMEDRTPWIPLIPMYRYEYGNIIEYTEESRLAGRMHIEKRFGTGVRILYRMWVSAEEVKREEREDSYWWRYKKHFKLTWKELGEFRKIHEESRLPLLRLRKMKED
jgi:hypothetical protein